MNYDVNDDQFEISFMAKLGNLFQWPKREDIIWVERKAILCSIGTPVATAKRARMHSISPGDVELL